MAKKPIKNKAAAKGKGARPAKAKPAKKAAAKKAAPKKAAPKKAAPKKAAPRKAAPKKAPAKKAAPKKSRPMRRPPPPDAGSVVADFAGRAMIVQILGDAEAYFFDFARLGADKRAELIDHHLAGFDRRKRDEGKSDWAESFVPVALIGESMPPVVRARFDLSAPHEGVLVFHRGTGALLHASSKDDEQLAIVAPDLGMLAPRPSFVDELFEPAEQSYAYDVDRSTSSGFTRSQIELLMQTGGAQLTLV